MLAGFYERSNFIITLVLLGTSAAACNGFVGRAAAAQKSIEVERQHRDEPVVITSVTVGNIAIQCGLVSGAADYQPVLPFDADDNWLQSTTLYLLNRTNKNIVYGQIALLFPETGDGSQQRPIATYNITFGQIPDMAAFSSTESRWRKAQACNRRRSDRVRRFRLTSEISSRRSRRA
jgi:hypothetical protein